MPSNTFEAGFHLMMSSALECEWRTKNGKPTTKNLMRRLSASSDWLDGLTDFEYSGLIH